MDGTVETPPPPPPVRSVRPRDLEVLQEKVDALLVEMLQTNVRVRFKLSTYDQWLRRMDDIKATLMEIRGT